MRVQFFDPAAAYDVWEGRRLPHWGQAGTVCFITWRTWDSIPSDVLKRWLIERERWLVDHGIAPQSADWRSQVQARFPDEGQRYLNLIAQRWDTTLDECRGDCVLSHKECLNIIHESLLHFDGDRYEMLDLVIMPNHVHLLASFPSFEAMWSQIRSWKRYTAGEINRQLGLTGRLWQTEDFDHLVRGEDQLYYYRDYIADNPRKAGLAVQPNQHYSRELR